MYEDVKYSIRGKAAWVVINRPQVRNAFRSQTLEELQQAVERADNDTEVRVIVVSGAGDRAFCAGGDIPEESTFKDDAGRIMTAKAYRVYDAIRGADKVVIAAVNGDAVGGGNELQMWCDFTIAAKHARFGQSGTRVGSCPTLYGTQGMPRVIGEKRGREVVYMSRLYSAETAATMGWINSVVEGEKLQNEVDKWCDRLVDIDPHLAARAKVALNHESALIRGSLNLGELVLGLAQGCGEFKEGFTAFVEKRKPDFWAKAVAP